MRDPAKTPSSSSALPESPSRKRLLAHPKPKRGSAAASSDSALSSDSSSERFRKNTRDLPNLSDCHCCGLHVNSTNPMDKLQTLDSVWRIVLLCRKCTKRVESAEVCSYCFSKADADCYRCRDCERCIHRDCVSRYQCSAPWSYCCSKLGFSVCVDCWVPKLLANWNKVYKRRNKKKLLEPCSAGDSRVSGNSSGPKSLEDVVNDAKSVVEKKTAVVAKAKKNALRKAMVARRAVEFANYALELVAKKDGNGTVSSTSCASDGTTTMVVDDAELAFELHRAMNSSPRISKNLCLMNSSCLAVPRIRDCNGDLLVRSSGSRVSSPSSVSGKIEVCPAPTNKLNENTDATVSEPVYARPSDSGSRISLGNLKQDGLVYTRRCKKDKQCRGKGGGIVGNCNPGDGNSLISELTCQKQDELEYDPDDTRNQSLLTCDGNATVLHDGKCDGKLDRYMLKYSKRCVGLKPISNSERKNLYDGSCVESKAKAAGLPLNCSEECRSFSDASCQSFTISLQSSACASGTSRDPS